MGRQKRTGKDRMTTTSVHCTIGVLDSITELGHHQSTFIRQAIEEKLEREEGFKAAIKVQSALVDSLLDQTTEEQEKLLQLHESHKEWKKIQERKRIRDIVITEYFTGTHKSKDALYEALKRGVKTDEDLEAVVNEVWEEIQMEEKK